MPEVREKQLNELLSHDMCTLYVGEENTCWILHEKLLCHRSKFFRNIFDPRPDRSRRQTSVSGTSTPRKNASKISTYGLPDVDDAVFRLFVAWLYADTVPPPREEKDLTTLLELGLLSEKWEIQRLTLAVLEAVRRFYHETDTWPGLRRVQFVYANTSPESPLRKMLVSCVARMLIVGTEGMPAHWERALRRDGQLAVDVILCVQGWRIEPEAVPDEREQSVLSSVEENVKEETGKRGEQIDRKSGLEEGVSGLSVDSSVDSSVAGGSEEEEEEEGQKTPNGVKQEPLSDS